jgi:hypothetical protein
MTKKDGFIKTSDAAHRALRTLQINNSDRNPERMRRFINDLILKGILKGEKRDGHNYYVDKDDVDGYMDRIKRGQEMLPTTLNKQFNTAHSNESTNKQIALVKSFNLTQDDIKAIKNAIGLYEYDPELMSLEQLTKKLRLVLSKEK